MAIAFNIEEFNTECERLLEDFKEKDSLGFGTVLYERFIHFLSRVYDILDGLENTPLEELQVATTVTSDILDAYCESLGINSLNFINNFLLPATEKEQEPKLRLV